MSHLRPNSHLPPKDMAADGDTDYDVENREYKDVTITLHTRWDAADVTGTIVKLPFYSCD